jgi:hypothetical protein
MKCACGILLLAVALTACEAGDEVQEWHTTDPAAETVETADRLECQRTNKELEERLALAEAVLKELFQLALAQERGIPPAGDVRQGMCIGNCPH